MIGSCITFEDLYTGTITDLRSDSSYTFQSDTMALSLGLLFILILIMISMFKIQHVILSIMEVFR